MKLIKYILLITILTSCSSQDGQILTKGLSGLGYKSSVWIKNNSEYQKKEFTIKETNKNTGSVYYHEKVLEPTRETQLKRIKLDEDYTFEIVGEKVVHSYPK